MPALATVTDEEVWDAGRALAAEGKAVNGWALRRVIGRGDPNRLHWVWRDRERRQAGEGGGAAVQQPVVHPLPPVAAEQVSQMQAAIAGQVEALASGFWHAAERLAAERLQGEAEAARAEASALRVQLDEAEAVLVAADEARAEAVEQVEAMAVRLQRAEQELGLTQREAERAAGVAAALLAESRAETERVRADLRAAMETLGRLGPAPAVVPPAV